jgi:hypothetical protein
MRDSKGEAEKRAKRLGREINDRWGIQEVNYQITPTVVSAPRRDPSMNMEEVAAGRSKPPTVH